MLAVADGAAQRRHDPVHVVARTREIERLALRPKSDRAHSRPEAEVRRAAGEVPLGFEADAPGELDRTENEMLCEIKRCA